MPSQDEEGRRRARETYDAGVALRREGRHEEALAELTSALELYRGLHGTRWRQADCLHGMGLVLRETGRYEEALTSFQDALSLYRKIQRTER